MRVHPPSARPEPTRRRRSPRLAAVVAVLALVGGGVAGAPTAAAAPSRSPGTLTVSGYDYLTGAAADVVVTDPDTNLVVTFTARRALEDGTLTVALPGRDWTDPLQVGDRLVPDDPTKRGDVVVRPSVDYDELTDADCRAAEGETLSVAVTNQRDVRTATVSHLSCAAGQAVTLRVFDVRAPSRTGVAPLAVTVRDAPGGSTTVLPVVVRPVPTTRLELTPSRSSALTGETVTFTVTALDTRSRRLRVDTGYRGTVNLVGVGVDCFIGSAERLPVTFTAADRGTKTVNLSFGAPQTFRIEAYDVARRALPGYSTDVVVSASPGYETATCSRAYH